MCSLQTIHTSWLWHNLKIYLFYVHRFVSKYVMSALKQGNADVIKELLQDTWSHWPIRGLEAIDKFSEAPEYLQHADLKQVSQLYVHAVL